MKIFVLFLCVVLMAFSAAFDEDEVQACKEKCLTLPKDPVCSVGPQAETYYNECEMNCDGAKMAHRKDCEYKDLMDNFNGYKPTHVHI